MEIQTTKDPWQSTSFPHCRAHRACRARTLPSWRCLLTGPESGDSKRCNFFDDSVRYSHLQRKSRSSPLVIPFLPFLSPHGASLASSLVFLPLHSTLHSPPSFFPSPRLIHGIMGPDQQPQIDGFGLTFPFPLRVATLLVVGMWSPVLALSCL